jgi:hypothetical protein
MEYMLMFYNTAENQVSAMSPEKARIEMGAWGAYIGAIKGAGIVVAGHGLQAPSTATTLSMRGEKRHIQDGPFADSKEQLGGYYVINVPTLDDALEWAARSPTAATGKVEVRPVLSPPTNLPT